MLETAIKKAIGRYAKANEQTIITDIHLQPNPNSGELLIFNDEDEELGSVTVEEWIAYKGDDFYEAAQRVLTNLLNELKKSKALDNLSIMKPYSLVLVDDERETVAELLLMDDDTLLVNDELLKGLDDELDSFLKHLLEE